MYVYGIEIYVESKFLRYLTTGVISLLASKFKLGVMYEVDLILALSLILKTCTQFLHKNKI